MHYIPPIDFLKISEYFLNIIKENPEISGILFVLFCFITSFSIIIKETTKYNKKILTERLPGKRSVKIEILSLFFLILGIIILIIMIF